MADKRMFSKKLIDSDAFLDMPISAQGLFFHLCMRADDDGFVDAPKRIVRECQASSEDLQMLIDKRYILTFPNSNVIVIKHWRLHNTIPKDRYKPTLYTEEKSQIGVKPNGAYTDDPAKMASMSTTQHVTPKTKNSFNRCSQRQYSSEQFEELERQLTQKGAKDGG
nr:MAG TPA: replisome organizer [Bacteriophage sp.]